MKKLFFILALTITVITISFSQSMPFKYQAVIHDNNGNILPDKNVGLRVSILQGASPTMVYREEFNKTSDQFGIINLEVGTGSVLDGNYLTIDWSVANNQLKIEIDMNGGTTYSLLGASSILSAPIANYAVKAGAATFPAGMVIAFAGDTAKIPEGWVLCDGRAVSRTVKYNLLFQSIGISWGAGDGINFFNLPDLRGQFLRGTDLGASVDPDLASRTVKNSGVSPNSKVGTFQDDIYGSHKHTALALHMASGSGAGGGNFCDGTDNGSSSNTSSTGGSETRPKNAYVNYIIKY